MTGKASRPISVTTAPTMPVAVANSVQVMRVATASDPGSPPAASWIERNRRSRMLARSMM
jgi:hypothetical protein